MTTAIPVAEDGARRERLLARSITAVATLAFAVAALGDVAAPLPAGHYASSASVGIVADNMIRWHVPWPVWSYTATAPGPDLAYGHHPWGIFWVTTAIFAVFGRSDLTCRLAPLILSTATIPMLYAVGARLHRPLAGAVGAALFAALPISLAFATFNALEVPVIAWSVLSTWGFAGLWGAAPRRRDAIAFGLGALAACESDWPGFLTAGFLVGGGLVALARRPVLRGGHAGRLRWTALLATGFALAAALVAQIAWLHAIGKWDDLLLSYDLRSSGRTEPIWRVIAARRWWLELCFTNLGLAVAATGVPLLVWRAIGGRRALELAPLALGVTATIQYVVFRQGADVHVFWPQHFTPFIALVAAAWTATGLERGTRAWQPGAVVVGALVAIVWVARDGVAALRYARSTGGRFDEKGLLIHSDGDTIAALRTLAAELPSDGVVILDRGMKPTWSQHFALGRPSETHAGFPDEACASERGGGSPAAWVADLRFLPAPWLREVATQCATRSIGPILVARPGPYRPIEARRLDERAGEGLSGYLRAASEPLRTPAPDPFGTWELRLHLDQPMGDLPRDPSTVDELRIADSASRTGADGRGSQRSPGGTWEMPGMRPVGATFQDGTRIVGVIEAQTPGAANLVLVEAGGPLQPGVMLSVVGRIVEPMPLSLTRPDPHRREMAMPSRIPPMLWREGWLYAIEVFVHPRPGTEELRARFIETGSGRAPRLASKEPDVVIGTHPARDDR